MADDSKPFPHGELIGGYIDTWHEAPKYRGRLSAGPGPVPDEERILAGLIRHKWYGLFQFEKPLWKCYFTDEEEAPYLSLFGAGETPRKAFEQLVSAWTFANGGVESPYLKAMLGSMRSEMDAYGFTD